MPWLPGYANLGFHAYRLRNSLRCVTSCCSCIGRGYTHVQGGTATGDSSGGENTSRPGLQSCELFGFCGDAWGCEFFTAYHSVNACVMPPRGFGGAAGFSVLVLWVQERTTYSALTQACPRSVSNSFLHVGGVIVRRQDTSRTCVEVVEPFVGDLRVAQVFDPRNLLPGSFGEECVLQAPESSPVGQP